MRSGPMIEIRTLGPFEVRVGGEPLKIPRHAPRRQLQLLKVLVALGGQSVPIEQLIEALWPDAEGDKALQAFHSTLHRLRERFCSDVVRVRDGRVGLDGAVCRVDALELVAAIEESHRALEMGDLSRSQEGSGRALSMYRAPFLDGEFEPAAIPVARTRLHALFLRHVERIGKVLEGDGRRDEAIGVYREALAIDPSAEEIAQALMRCCLEARRHSEGLAAYETLRQTLYAQYEVEPGEATRALHRELVQAAQVRPRPETRRAPPPAMVDAETPPTTSVPRPELAAQRIPPERRPVTVVTSRFAGYAELLECLDVEEVKHVLVEIREEALRIIESHGGVLNNIGGDGLMAFFGVAPAHDDDLIRAVRAALSLHGLARWEHPIDGDPQTALRLQTGIATSLHLVVAPDAPGGPYQLTGTAVDAAARLAALADPGAILLSPDDRHRVAEFFALEALGGPEDGNASASPRAYRVLRETAVRTRFQAAERRGFTPYVGRERERAQLSELLARTIAGHGQLVTVSGEAGIGKSRLVYELRRSVDPACADVLEGRCQSYGTATPYRPFLDALRRALQLSENDPPEQLHEKAIAGTRAVDPALERYLPHYLHLLSIHSETHRMPETLQGEALRRELEEALAAGFTLAAQKKPLLLILEDWHWADDASQSALRSLIGLIARHPLMAVVLYRPEEHEPAWGHPEHLTALDLRPLELEDTAAMFRHVLSTPELPEGLMPRVHERTGGNAFFNEELALALLELGLIVVENDRARLSKPVDEIELPETVQATLRARVDRLAPEDREVLRLASVIGREFDRAVLEEIAPAREAVAGSLERLGRQEMVRPLRLLPQAEYLFKHVLTQEVAYETLLLSQRKELHAAVGTAIETLFADRLAEHFEALAFHYSHSEETDKAIEYLEKAGDKAAGAFSLVESRRYYREAIRLLRAGARPPEDTRQKIDLALKWTEVSAYAPTEELLALLDQCAREAAALNDTRSHARVVYWMGRMERVRGNLIPAIRHFEDTIRIGREANDMTIALLGQAALGRTCLYTDRLPKVRALLEDAIPRLEAVGNMEEVAYCCGFLGMVRAWMGEFRPALELCSRALRIAEALGNRTRESASYLYLSVTYNFRGEWSNGAMAGLRVSEVASRHDEPYVAAMGHVWGGYAQGIGGNLQGGIDEMQAGIEGLMQGHFRMGITKYLACLGELHALANRRAEAIRCAQRTFELAHTGEIFGQYAAYRVLGMVEAVRPRPGWTKVEELFCKSIAAAEAIGMWSPLAVTYFRFADVLSRKGDLDGAAQHLRQASARFQEMDMPWWLEQAKALRGRLKRGEPFVWFAPYVDGPPKLDA